MLRRLLRDYVGGQSGLLGLSILCMLLAAAAGGAIPQFLNWETKYIFLRHDGTMLLPLAGAGFAVMAVRAIGTFFGRMLIDSLGEKTVAAAQREP